MFKPELLVFEIQSADIGLVLVDLLDLLLIKDHFLFRPHNRLVLYLLDPNHRGAFSFDRRGWFFLDLLFGTLQTKIDVAVQLSK